MAFGILGAPGSGKTAVQPILASLLPEFVVIDWDGFMGAARALSGSDIRITPALWPAYGQLVRTVIDAVGPERVVLLTVTTPAELGDWPIDSWALLDCSDTERRRRLETRSKDDPGSALVDAASYRTLGLRVIDTTDISPDAAARRLADLIHSGRGLV